MHSISIFYSIAIYKALYKRFGGFAADVVAAIDQVCVRTFICHICVSNIW